MQGETDDSKRQLPTIDCLHRTSTLAITRTSKPTSPAADNQVRSKRRCVSIACIACRRRKSKCDGNLPSCAACASVYHTPCIYDPNSDHRRKGVYRWDADTLRARNTTLQTLIQAILTYDEEDAFELVRQMRSCDNLEEIAESIAAGEKERHQTLGETVSTNDENPALAGQFEMALSGKMGELLLDGSRKFIGGTSNLIFLPPGSELHESHVLNNEQHARQRESTVCSWTSVTDDNQLIRHLLTLYFTWHYPFFTALSRDLFYRDYVRGVPSQYCSSLLVNVMLSLGCHFSACPGARAEPQNSATAGDHFFKEAKRLLLENDEHENAKLCTVQALALMSVREAGCGREGRGWVYSGMSFRMAFDLGLNLDVCSLGAHALSEEEIDARRITFWGCYLFDKCWSNYLGRLPQLTTSNANVPKYDILPNEEAELWSRYTDAGIGDNRAQPSRVRGVALYIVKLSEISGDLLLYFYHPSSAGKRHFRQTELKRLSEIHTRLEAWNKDLPKEVEPKEGQLPQVFIMHMFYQLLFIHLYRPFLKYNNKPNSPLPAHVSPRKLCTQAASAISKLLRMYKRTYGLSQICNIVVYIVHTACTVHLLNLPNKNAQRDLVHGIKHLEEMGESWLCARRTLRILDISASKWQVELPVEAVDILERTHARWGSWGSWDQTASPMSSDDSQTMFLAWMDMHATAPSSHSSPGGLSAQPLQTHFGHPGSVPSPAGELSPPSFPAGRFSVPPALPATAITSGTMSSGSPLQHEGIVPPEPTYLRPMAHVSYPLQSFTVPQDTRWQRGSGGQIQAMMELPNSPPSTSRNSSPSREAFDARDLSGASPTWWSVQHDALPVGTADWNPSYPSSMMFEMSYGSNVVNRESTGVMDGSSPSAPGIVLPMDGVRGSWF